MSQGFAQYDFDLPQGTTLAGTIQINNADGTATDLTGFSAMMRWRVTPSGAVKLEASTTNGKLSIPTPTSGQIQLNITAADTQALIDSGDGASVTYVYDLVTYDSGTPQVINPVIQGKITLTPQITRPWS